MVPGALTVSGAVYVSAVLRDAAGYVLPGRTVTWTVADTLVATVTIDGLVYARTPGKTTVVAASEGVSGSAVVTVPAPPPVASVAVSPSTLSLEVGQQWQLSYALLDSAGHYRYASGPTIWSTSDSTRVTVTQSGVVRAVGIGIATISATSNGVRGSSTVGVIPTLPVASLVLSPDTVTVTTSTTRTFTVTVLDSAGNRLPTRPVSWVTSDSSIAHVESYSSTDAQIFARSAGTATIFAYSGGKQATAIMHVVPPPPVVQLTISPVTATLPVGRSLIVRTTALDAAGHVVYPPITWTISDTTKVVRRYYNGIIAVAPGTATVTASGGGKTALLTITVTTPVALPLTSVAAGHQNACGIAASGAAYCWGRSMFGLLGDGAPSDTLSHPVPVLVSGAQVFSSITVGDNHACALASGMAYCWGLNTRGQLGVGPAAPTCLLYGSTYPCSAVPLAVSAAFSSRQISAGATSVCVITSANAAFCWGDNSSGQLGIGTVTSSAAPAAVTGMPALSSISLGRAHACGLAPDGTAFCWGSNTLGQIGAPTKETCADAAGRIAGCSTVPQVVTGGLTFTSIAAGGDHTCALSATGSAYCWGANASGELGNGSQTSTDIPTPVAGGTRFTSLTAGEGTTCGIVSGGDAYCWGLNVTTPYAVNPSDRYSLAPLLVAGGVSFETISAGASHVCGVATSHLAYCWGSFGFGQLGIGYEGLNTPPQFPVTRP